MDFVRTSNVSALNDFNDQVAGFNKKTGYYVIYTAKMQATTFQILYILSSGYNTKLNY